MPFVGYVTIMLSEHPWLKTVMLGIMGLVVVLQREYSTGKPFQPRVSGLTLHLNVPDAVP
jgi:hypothetical protein